ncbi:MAG: RNA polymerase subunit sigma, partial [Pseudolabrys sp.]
MSDLNIGDQAAAELGGDGNASNQITPEAELIAKSDVTRLEAATRALPVQFREALILRDVQG